LFWDANKKIKSIIFHSFLGKRQVFLKKISFKENFGKDLVNSAKKAKKYGNIKLLKKLYVSGLRKTYDKPTKHRKN